MQTESPAPSRAGSRTKAVIAAVLAVLCLVVFFQNLQSATVQWFFWSASMPKIVLMLLMLFVGFVLGWILATLRTGRKPTPDFRSET